MQRIGDLQLFKAAFFRALGNPVRIRLLEELGSQTRSVTELQRVLGAPQPIISQHLGILRSHHLVRAERRGGAVIYSLSDPLVLTLLATARRIFEKRLAVQTTMLRAVRRKAP